MNRSFGLAMIVTVLTASAAHASDWVARNVTIKGGGNIGIGTTSIGEIEDRAGNFSAELTINCSKGATTVFVTSKFTSFGRDDVPLEYTTDGDGMQKARWSICDDRNCAGLWDDSGIRFIKSLFGKSTLRMTFYRRVGEPLSATFPIAGVKEAIGPVGAACGWIPQYTTTDK
jgi:hypothetical protein